MNPSTKNVNKMIKISLLAAIAVVLMYFDFPIIPAFPWLKIDLSEVPALMGGFAYGPVAGGVIVVLKVFLRFLIKGTETGFVGEIANIIVGLALVVPSAWIYNKNKSKKTGRTYVVFPVFLLLDVRGTLCKQGNVLFVSCCEGRKDVRGY